MADSVTYLSDKRSQWRCRIYTMFHWRLLLMIVGIIGCGILILSLLFGKPPGFDDVLAMIIGPFLAMTLLHAHHIHKVAGKHGENSVTSIDERGVTDSSSGKTIAFPWAKINEISVRGGDVYFHSFAGTIFVPACAFASDEEAARFCDHARALRSSSRMQLTNSTVLELEDQTQVSADKMIQQMEEEEEAFWKNLEENHQQDQE